MDNGLIGIIILLVCLVYLYYRSDENFTTITKNNSNIWKVGEILKVGDVKSSPDGHYKYVMTKNGLQYYSEREKIYEKYNNPKNNWWFYPSLIGGSGSKFAKLTSNGIYISSTNFKTRLFFEHQIGTFKGDNNKYILSNFAVNGGYNVYDSSGNLLFNTNSNQNNTKYNNKIYNNINLSISERSVSDISKLILTDNGIFGYDRNDKLIFVN